MRYVCRCLCIFRASYLLCFSAECLMLIIDMATELEFQNEYNKYRFCAVILLQLKIFSSIQLENSMLALYTCGYTNVHLTHTLFLYML